MRVFLSRPFWAKFRTACLAVLALFIALANSAPACADDQHPSWREIWKWREVWSGVDVAQDNWLVYTGVTVAPFNHIHEEGLRLRFTSGYGQYAYTGNRAASVVQSFEALTYYGDALIGYLDRFGPLTAKAFVGIAYSAHDIAPFDPENLVIGDDIGLKGVLELWLDIGTVGFASLDVSWSNAHETRAARSRLGARFSPSMSGGLEAWLNLDAQSDCDLGWDNGAACNSDEETSLIDYTRAGLFLRYEWDGGEVSVSGGISGGSFMSSGDANPEPFGTINWMTQF
jgi:hypothetical protein